MLAKLLSRYWWMTLLRGALWILFGIIVLTRPGISLAALTFTFGVFALADGLGSVVTAIAGRKQHEDWAVLLLAGLSGICIGLLTFVAPGITVLTLLFYIAVWAIATGLLAFVAAIRLRKEVQGEFWLALVGLASMAFGVMLVARPGVGILAVLQLLAFYALALGLMLVALAFRVRSIAKRIEARVAA